MLLCSLLSYTAPRKTRISVLVQKCPPSLSALSACQQNGNTSAYKKNIAKQPSSHRETTVIAS